jgi:hypothetical protein
MPQNKTGKPRREIAGEKKAVKNKAAEQQKRKRAIIGEMVKSGQLTLTDEDIRVTPYQAMVRRAGSFGSFGRFGVVVGVVDHDPTDGRIDHDQRDDWFFDMDPTDAIYNVDSTDGKPSDGRF